MLRARGQTLLLGVLFILLLCIAVIHATLYREHLSPDSAAIRFEIPKGTSVRGAATRLTNVGLLDAPWKLRAVYLLQGEEGTIKAGTYEIELGHSAAALLSILQSGRVATIEVTLPEGWTLSSSCQQLARSLELNQDSLLTLCENPIPSWREELHLPQGASLEGYLYPETYRFELGASAREVIGILVQNFLRAFDESLRTAADSLGLSVHQAVTLASIVEAETRVPAERPKVAAVYLNRLAKHWKLEADPTVAYATGIPGEKLSTRDLRYDSPYNTYRYSGLPPGPINSPGRAALAATVHPERDFPAMYFVADGTGGHVFSRTWAEHRNAVRAYRSARRSDQGN